MADTVRNLLEQMLPELEELQDRGYFSKSEVKIILRKRAYFEYLMKRKALRKADALSYLQYESSLEELRQHRKAALGLNMKTGSAEASITRRMHFILERATRRFKGDLSLWLGWLQLCRDSKSHKRFAKVAARALQLHPTEPGLWARVALWEWEVNSDAAAARALIQRGLRACARAASLWADYFQLELLFAAKLAARRRVLGLPLPTSTLRESADDEPAVAPTTAADADGQPQHDAPLAATAAEDAAIIPVLRGDIAGRVFDGAVAVFPDNLGLRLQCLHSLQAVGLAGSEALADRIQGSIDQHCCASEAAWDLRARRAQGDPDSCLQPGASAAEEVFEEAVSVLPTSRMYSLYCTFLAERLAAAQSSQDRQMRGHACQWTKLLLAAHDRAIASGCADEELLLEHSQLLLASGQVRSAVQAARDACACHPHAVKLWQHSLVLHGQLPLACEPEADAPPALVSLTGMAARALPPEKAAAVWRTSAQLLLQLQAPLQGLIEQFADCVVGSQASAAQVELGRVAAELLDAVHSAEGLAAARRAYRHLLQRPAVGVAFFLALLRLEVAQQLPQRLPAADLRGLFEAAVYAHGADSADLWLEYCTFEQLHCGQGVGKLHWRARKTLKDPAAFLQQLQSEA